jgi:Fic family protein
VPASAPAVAALARIAALPGVPAAVDEARTACTRLRWHPALRRRAAEARAEAGVRAVRSSAALAGARLPLPLVRDAARGAAFFPVDAAGRTAHGVLRAHAEAEALVAGWERAPLQALARLHVVAVAGLVPDDALGRPRRADEEPGDGADLLTSSGSAVPPPPATQLPGRLAALTELLAAPPAVPALVVAGLVLAEITTLRPFVTGNGVVARALCRAVVVGRGLDPTGVAVWEAGLLAAGPPVPLALARYGQGSLEGVRGWLVLFARAVVEGAAEGGRVADAVLAGRLDTEL